MTERSGFQRLRSLLFAPATSEDVIAKIGTRGADAVVIDCEDAVAPDLKPRARQLAVAAAAALADQGVAVTVRVNSPSTGWFADDVAALPSAATAVVVPKVERVGELEQIDSWMNGRLGHLGVVVGIETALGVADVRELVAHPRVVGVYFGAEDFVADMGGRRTASNAEVAYARSRVALAARLAGVAALDQIVADFGDDDRFRTEAAEALALGYAGKLCIHPRQVALANEAFSPSSTEVDRARRLLDTYEQGRAAGRGVVVFEGQMIDEPLVAQARRIVKLS